MKEYRENRRRIVYVHQLNPVDGSENTKIFLVASAKGPIASAYLKNTNTRTFIKWLQQNVMNTLPAAAVFVLSEPSVFQDFDTVPKSTDQKVTMVDWLKKHEIPFEADLFKIELYDLIEQTVREQDSRNAFLLDTELKKMGHEVLYIPKENCDLNPLEYVLMHIKLKTIATGGSFDLDAELRCLQRDKWTDCFQRTIAYENTYLGVEEKIKNAKKNYQINRAPDDPFPSYTTDVTICNF